MICLLFCATPFSTRALDFGRKYICERNQNDYFQFDATRARCAKSKFNFCVHFIMHFSARHKIYVMPNRSPKWSDRVEWPRMSVYRATLATMVRICVHLRRRRRQAAGNCVQHDDEEEKTRAHTHIRILGHKRTFSALTMLKKPLSNFFDFLVIFRVRFFVSLFVTSFRRTVRKLSLISKCTTLWFSMRFFFSPFRRRRCFSFFNLFKLRAPKHKTEWK